MIKFLQYTITTKAKPQYPKSFKVSTSIGRSIRPRQLLVAARTRRTHRNAPPFNYDTDKSARARAVSLVYTPPNNNT